MSDYTMHAVILALGLASACTDDSTSIAALQDRSNTYFPLDAQCGQGQWQYTCPVTCDCWDDPAEGHDINGSWGPGSVTACINAPSSSNGGKDSSGKSTSFDPPDGNSVQMGVNAMCADKCQHETDPSHAGGAANSDSLSMIPSGCTSQVPPPAVQPQKLEAAPANLELQQMPSS